MGITSAEFGVNHVRLCKERFDLTDPNVSGQVATQIMNSPGKPRLWGAIPCTGGSPWQHMNAYRYGNAQHARQRKQVLESRRIFRSFVEAAEATLQQGGEVSFEWPRHCSYWRRSDVAAFCAKHPEFIPVDFEGCAVGLTDAQDAPIKKPWRVMTTSRKLADELGQHRCQHERGQHAVAERSETSKTAFYPVKMTQIIIRSLFPNTVQEPSFKAMPCVPVALSAEHRPREQPLKHVSALAGADDLAVIFDEDPQAEGLVAQLCDHVGLL